MKKFCLHLLVGCGSLLSGFVLANVMYPGVPDKTKIVLSMSAIFFGVAESVVRSGFSKME